jgi:hypothetical protein
MTSEAQLFGFGTSSTDVEKNYPLEFLGHYLIGNNPNDELHGCFDTAEEAKIAFASQFAELAEKAKDNFLFVRRAPTLQHVRSFEYGTTKWQMVGRFSFAKLKEKNNG